MQIRTRVVRNRVIVAEAAIELPASRAEGRPVVGVAASIARDFAGLAGNSDLLVVELCAGVPTQNGGRALSGFMSVEGKYAKELTTGANFLEQFEDWFLNEHVFDS